MRPLNQGESQRIAISEKYSDHKGGFTATRKKLKSGELGLWAKFMGLEGVGGEASVSAERSDSDKYEFDGVETESFYPNSKYISDCLKLSDVEDYLKGSRYKKPVYLVTGIKVGQGITVRMNEKTNVKGKLEIGLNNPGGDNIKIGPKAGGKSEFQSVYIFTESSDIVVGIQCLKIYHDRAGWLFGEKEVKSEYVASGATFYGEGGKATEETLPKFTAVNPEDYNSPHLNSCADGSEIWMLPKEQTARIS